MHRRFLAYCSFLILSIIGFSQTVIEGTLLDDEELSIPGALIYIKNTDKKTITDNDGNFTFELPQDTIVVIAYDGDDFYQPSSISHNVASSERIILTAYNRVTTLDTAVIDRHEEIQKHKGSQDISRINLEKEDFKHLPVPAPDVARILASLGSVVTTNELSTTYSVRGGNYDENLIYVNEFPIYRPYLAKAGQQEGLSFVNLDLTSSLDFYAGGWSAKYGDKLSSVLDVQYGTPDGFDAAINLSLLSNSVYVGNSYKKDYFMVGVRNKSVKYLLNTLETEGEYFPNFFDVQGMYGHLFSKNTKLELLTSYARNRYTIIPATRSTSFGTSDQIVQLLMGFDGQEQLTYDTYQSGVKLDHYFTKRHRAKLIVTGVYSREREFQDLEKGYELCDAATSLEEDNRREECLTSRGFGSIYNYARNSLDVKVLNTEYKGFYQSSDSSIFEHEWGVSHSHEVINDEVYEYQFEDSSEYVELTRFVKSDLNLETDRFNAFYNLIIKPTDQLNINVGTRVGYWTGNKDLIVSPRLRLAHNHKNDKKETIIYKVALGVYQQPPFYRELRDLSGNINLNQEAQASYQLIFGRDKIFKMFDRPFKMSYEIYGKFIDNVIPYDLDDVKIRYYANSDAHAYVVGGDFRLSGEFIHDEESWISIGMLSTRENIDGDREGYIRRPTDQRLTFGLFIQDHLPNNPLFKAHVNVVYGTGLPFAPLGNPEYRNLLNAPSYRRVDLGFSKMILLRDQEVHSKSLIESIWVSLEIMNLLAVSNTISYIWIEDFNGSRYAVPNTLSQRFVNLKVNVNF